MKKMFLMALLAAAAFSFGAAASCITDRTMMCKIKKCDKQANEITEDEYKKCLNDCVDEAVKICKAYEPLDPADSFR